MHPLVFHIKRAHWRCVARLEPEIRQFEMTCARFDVMHALDSSFGGALTQAQLARQLGVSRQTIWEMVIRMVRRRLVSKGDDPNMGRVVVQLTAKGHRCVAKARRLLRYDRVQSALRACFSWLEPEPARRDIALLKYNVRFVARGFGDTSTYGDFIDECFHPKPPVFGRKRPPSPVTTGADFPDSQDHARPPDTPALPSAPHAADAQPSQASQSSQPSPAAPLWIDGLWRVSVLDAITAWRGGPLSLRMRG
jgi:DNA-binding MarR family transcriptional regulator